MTISQANALKKRRRERALEKVRLEALQAELRLEALRSKRAVAVPQSDNFEGDFGGYTNFKKTNAAKSIASCRKCRREEAQAYYKWHVQKRKVELRRLQKLLKKHGGGGGGRGFFSIFF